MSTKPLLLEAHVDARDDTISRLQEENSELRQELLDVRRELRQTVSANTNAIAALRHQLSPLYQALQRVFGEMESFAVEDSGGGAPLDSRKAKVWQAWKSKFPSSAAKIIDALLLHGEMNTQQLAIAVGLHRTTIPALIYKLNQAGLLNKSGGRFSLKEL